MLRFVAIQAWRRWPLGPFLLVFSRQVYFSGVQSAGIVVLTAVLVGVGFVLAFQAAVASGPSPRALEILALVAVRSFAVLVAIFIFSARSVTAITAELGLMGITGEIRTLRRLGISPVSYLLLPRVLAASLSVALLYVYFVAAAILAGELASGFGIDLVQLGDVLDSIKPFDFFAGVLRCAAFAAVVVIWISRLMTHAPRGFPDVSRSVSEAVLQSILLMLGMEAGFQLFCLSGDAWN